MNKTISFVVNGEKKSVDAPPMSRLLDVLREHLHLTGTKEGCGEGECGSCSVMMNGELVNICWRSIRRRRWSRSARGWRGISAAARDINASLMRLRSAGPVNNAIECD